MSITLNISLHALGMGMIALGLCAHVVFMYLESRRTDARLDMLEKLSRMYED